ncbi:hypothetical protein [Acinetobacter pittii]|uniref:hypothetical protein n=1 Tax=Acinetobacter pittii TaxID=48296 RepID=UPI00355BAC94
MQNSTTEKIPFYRSWVFWAVLFYLLFILLYTLKFYWSEGENVLLPSNALGDFLAGAFAPLAFLFLYLGYRQQGNEMKQNTEALKLQAEELKNSVKEQKRLIDLHENEQKEKHFQVLPDFKIKDKKAQRYTHPLAFDDEDGNVNETIDEELLGLSFTLFNQGEMARNVLVKSLEDEFYVRETKYKINFEEELRISFELNGQIINSLENGAEYFNTLVLTFNNIYGKGYTKFIHYGLSAHADPEEEKFYFSFSPSIISDKD